MIIKNRDGEKGEMTMKSYIGRCIYAPGEHRGGGWIIQTYNFTGNAWGDESCPHYHSRAAARAALAEQREYDDYEGDGGGEDDGPIHTEHTPSYSAAMRDAGRGGLLR